MWAPAIVGAFHVEPAVVQAGAPFVRAVMVAVPSSAAVGETIDLAAIPGARIPVDDLLPAR